MPSEITKRICFLAIFVCITANCLAKEKTELPEIKIIEVEAEESRNAKEEGQMFRFEIKLGRDRIRVDSSKSEKEFLEYVKQFVSDEQKEYLEKNQNGYYVRSIVRSIVRRPAPSRLPPPDKIVLWHAVSIKDAEIMAHKLIEFFNDLSETNLRNLPNELAEAQKQIEELNKQKQQVEDKLAHVIKDLDSLREFPSEYTDEDTERVKAEFTDLRFLKKKTDIEIVGIRARMDKAQTALAEQSASDTNIRQYITNLYTEAQIMYADAQARNRHISELVNKYLKAITLFDMSKKLPNDIDKLALAIKNKNSIASNLEKEINEPEKYLSNQRKPLNVLDITIYDNSKNLKN